MKSGKIILFSIIGVLVLGVIWFISASNRLVGLDESVRSSWAQVENVYQRRLDLIPNLVNTVKGYAKHEQSTLLQVTEARNQASKIDLSKALDNPAKLQQLQKAQDQLSGALSRLMVVVEKYPDLKANENFRDLQSQLEGTENRITVERKRFNETVQSYNTTIRVFPTSIIAGMKGMQAKPYFEAQAGAANAPKVEF